VHCPAITSPTPTVFKSTISLNDLGEYFTVPPQALESSGIYWVSRDLEMAEISAKFTNQNPKNSIGPSIDIHRPNRFRRNPWNICSHPIVNLKDRNGCYYYYYYYYKKRNA